MDCLPSSSTLSEIAPWYDELLRKGSSLHETALATLMALVPDPVEGSLLDVACGQGLAARALVDRGAQSVTGIDAAAEMIKLAERRTPPTASVSWRVDDAERLETCDSASFDGVVCQLALMDIGDLDACLLAIRRVLKLDGWFVFVISHPCFLAPHATTAPDPGDREGRLISRYFDPEFWRPANPHGVRGRAGNYHRPLSSYLNSLISAHFQLDEFLEPRATPLLAKQQPVYQHVPIFFAGRAIAQ